MFAKEIERKISRIQEEILIKSRKIKEAKKFKLSYIREEGQIEDLQKQIVNLNNKKNEINLHGVQTTTSPGYYPRIYNINYLRTNEGHYHWMNVVGQAIGSRKAREALHKIILQNVDNFNAKRFDQFLDDVGTRSSQARLLEVEDELLIPFLDWNVEAVIRDHVRRMGIDIELTKKFGSIQKEDLIKGVTSKSAQKDLIALRDILRGTFGKPDDPFSHLSQSVAIAKRWSLLTQLGNIVTSSMSDMGRQIMTEGINHFVGSGLRAFISRQRNIIAKMNRQMLREAGEGWENVLAVRANAFADTGSDFGRMGKFENMFQKLESPFFFASGINWWNTAMKEWASLTISQRMFKAINKDWKKLSVGDKDKLLRRGIDGPMQGRMQLMYKKYSTTVDGYTFPNIGNWTDDTAAITFLNALSEDVSRTIVTPGAGDLALWTREHTGSMIAQFKSFAQASTQRVLISGLQERDKFFWQGAVMMTTLGMVVNEIKRYQYGIDHERTWGQILWEGVERAGLVAILADFNHISETVTNNRISMDALMGGNPQNFGPRRYMGEFGGPSGGLAYDLYNITSNGLSGNFSNSFWRSLRRTIPGQNLPWAIPLGQ